MENAIENLQIAIDKDFDDLEWIETETSLDFIRTDERYLKIIKVLDKKD